MTGQIIINLEPGTTPEIVFKGEVPARVVPSLTRLIQIGYRAHARDIARARKAERLERAMPEPKPEPKAIQTEPKPQAIEPLKFKTPGEAVVNKHSHEDKAKVTEPKDEQNDKETDKGTATGVTEGPKSGKGGSGLLKRERGRTTGKDTKGD